MSPSTLITLISLVLAVYALLPRDRKLELQLKWTMLDRSVILLVLALLHYLVFFSVFQALGLAPDLGPYRWGFNSELTAYTALMFLGIWLGVRSAFGGLSAGRIGVFRKLAVEWLNQGRYSDLNTLLSRHWPQLMSIYHDNSLVGRWRRAWSPTPLPVFFGDEPIGKPSFPVRFKSWAGSFLPNHSEERREASEAVQWLLTSKPFVRAMAQATPALGLTLLQTKFVERKTFQRIWLCALLDDTDSVLYREIEHNQIGRADGNGRGVRYEFSPARPVLWFYFERVKRSEELALFKTVGDYTNRFFDDRFQQRSDRFNEPLERYPELELDTCPVNASLRLFDFMISESQFQGIHWHMWLMYFTTFSRKIERNLAPTESVDLDAQTPTPYHYQLREILSLLCQWIENTRDLAVDAFVHEERSISFQASLALARVLIDLLMSDHLDGTFKVSLLDSVLGRASDWTHHEHSLQCLNTFVEALENGPRDVQNGENWMQRLGNYARRVDDHTQYELREVLLVFKNA